MINENKTFELFGYYSTDLKPQSNKKVIGECEICKDLRIMPKSQHNITNGRCIKCSYIGKTLSESHKRNISIGNKKYTANFRGPFNIEYFQAVQECIDESYINEIRTFKDFGYYSIDLSRGSERKVWVVCRYCKREREVQWLSIENNTGRCKFCANQKENHPMYGKTHTIEARMQISCAVQGIMINEWTGFIKDKPYCVKFNERCKENNRMLYGRECYICGRPEELNVTSENKHKKLSVHHVDMNKQQGCNGIEWKLIPVCIHCHSKLHTKQMQSCIEYMLKNTGDEI